MSAHKNADRMNGRGYLHAPSYGQGVGHSTGVPLRPSGILQKGVGMSVGFMAGPGHRTMPPQPVRCNGGVSADGAGPVSSHLSGCGLGEEVAS